MLTKKKIVIIGPAHPLRGGLASFNERLAKQFKDEGNEVIIYTFSLQYPSFLFPGTTQYSSEKAPNDLAIKVCINSINPFNWIRIGHGLKRMKPDLILVRFWLPFMGPCLGTICGIAKMNKKSTIVCLADNAIPHEKRFGDRTFTKYFIHFVDSFLTMSKKVKEDLVGLTSKSVQIIAHPLYDNFGEKLPITEARDYLKLPLKPTIFLFFGFIRKYKGLDLLFEAISILKEKEIFSTQNVQFLIAGEFYENEKPYLDLINKLEIQDWLQLRTHFIPDSEVRYYLSACDCVIQPYKHATQSGVTPLAYHFEKPMIVTNVGALPDLVPPSIGLVAEPNASDIAESIEYFFNKKNLEYSNSIKVEKLKYNWSTVTRAILELSKH